MVDKQGYGPRLNNYIDKKLDIKLNSNRRVVGVLKGFDQFMNIVLDRAIEMDNKGGNSIGTVIIRGNSIIMWECIDKVESLKIKKFKKK